MSNNQISQEIHTALNWMDRSEIVAILEGISIQCYDHESDAILREAVIQNIEDGTLDASSINLERAPARDRAYR